MRLTARRLNRAALHRQLLLRREAVGAVEAVRRLVALQAQHPASPYLALWARLDRFDPADVDAALADGTLVRATSLRVTLHLAHAADHRVLHTAMQPTLRSAGLDDRRFTDTGLAAADADALVPDLLRLAAVPRTPAEIEAWLAARVDGDTRGVLRALRCIAPLRHAPTGGPWSFGARPRYVAASPPDAAAPAGGPDAALPVLVRRYLEAFGPATVADVAQFARVPRSRVRAALASLEARDAVAGGAEADGVELERLEGPDGEVLHDVVGAPRPAEDTPAPPRLLPMWDDVLLAHADRSRLVPPDLRGLVVRRNGDVLPTVLVDGRVAGVWRPADDGVEVTAFRTLTDEAWDGLASEARSLGHLLADREPRVYSRYGHWWDALPSAEVRVLPGW